MKDQIIKAFGKASGVKDPSLEIPENEKHGDYSTNVAMVLAKKEGKNPREFAQELVTNLQKDKNLGKIVSKIEVAGPGFINFWLSKQVLNDILVDINKKKDAFGKSDFGTSLSELGTSIVDFADMVTRDEVAKAPTNLENLSKALFMLNMEIGTDAAKTTVDNLTALLTP